MQHIREFNGWTKGTYKDALPNDKRDIKNIMNIASDAGFSLIEKWDYKDDMLFNIERIPSSLTVINLPEDEELGSNVDYLNIMDDITNRLQDICRASLTLYHYINKTYEMVYDVDMSEYDGFGYISKVAKENKIDNIITCKLIIEEIY